MEQVSIVLATYNGEHYLRQQLDSILSQSYGVDEIVVVDDGSTDHTMEILSDYNSAFPGIFKIYLNKTTLGPTENFRKGASLAKSGNYVAFSDQDDIWLKDKLTLQIDAIRKKEIEFPNEPILVFHDLELMDENGNLLQKSFWDYYGFKAQTAEFKDILVGNIITGCTCLINNEMRREFLQMDSSKVIMHDYWLAFLAFGVFHKVLIDKSLIRYRNHTSSVTSKTRSSTFTKVFTHITEALQDRTYLDTNLLQAKLLKDKYYDKMPRKNQKTLDRFLKLEKGGYIGRKFRILYRLGS